ncbi:MAG: hypothetical protein E2604_11395 [Flavobacterium sp.]|nr:hypothetical protein [Flavobacterium sp.]HRB71481.1 hypothetical protein [Flavobacterium sp.]
MENEKALTDWLYNRFVEASRKGKHEQTDIYLELLNKCVNTMTQRKFGTLRRFARGRLKTIYTALKSGTVKKLLLTGDEGTKEFEKTISDYEKSLREMNFPEETIKELVIEKRINYGND